MTAVDQKSEERRILSEFLAAAQIVISNAEGTESPDFRVDTGDGLSFWVELVECHQGGNPAKGSIARQFEQQWWQLMRVIAETVDADPLAQSLHRVMVTLSTQHMALPPTRELEAIASELVCSLRQNLDLVKEQGNVVIRDFHKHRLSCKYVSEIELTDAGEAYFTYWYCDDIQAAWVGIQASELEEIVDSKRRKLQQYRTKIGHDEIWLLMYSLDSTAATFAPHPRQLRDAAMQCGQFLASSGFDQVWFYCRSDQAAVQLFPWG